MWLFELELFLFVNWYPSEHVVSAPSIFSSKKYFSIITFKRVWGQKNDKFWMNNRSHQVTWAKLLKNLWIFQYLFMQWVLSVYKKIFWPQFSLSIYLRSRFLYSCSLHLLLPMISMRDFLINICKLLSESLWHQFTFNCRGFFIKNILKAFSWKYVNKRVSWNLLNFSLKYF